MKKSILPTLADFVDYLIEEGGVHGIIPLGSTGEYYALSAEEREEVLKTTHRSRRRPRAGRRRRQCRLDPRCRRLLPAGRETWVRRACCWPRRIIRCPAADELFAHFRAVNDAIGIPIILYNYPGRTGVDMPPEFIERLAELKHVRYVKESTGDITRITEMLRRCGDRLAVFCGCDTIALESMLLGTPGWVSGTANVLPREHVEIYRIAMEKQDFLGRRPRSIN